MMRPTLLAYLLAALAGGGSVHAFVPPRTGLDHVAVLVDRSGPVAACCWPGAAADTTACWTARPSVARRRHLSTLRMMMAKIDPPPTGKTKNLGSYYRRPSAAIEKGGGFFVPGLEGFRLRFVLAAVILGLLSLNGFSRPGMSLSQIVSEALACLAGVALFSQALLDQQKERAVEMRRKAIAAAPASAGGENADASAGEGQVAFFDSAELGKDLESKVRWAADIVLQLTAACTFVAFADGKVLARVGDAGGESDDASVVAGAFKSATAAAAKAAETAEQDRGGAPSAIIVNDKDKDGDSVALMLLLPSACRQGVLCKVTSPLSEGDVVVLLGSTLTGAGVFSGLDGEWFERVCAFLALGPTAAAAGAPGR